MKNIFYITIIICLIGSVVFTLHYDSPISAYNLPPVSVEKNPRIDELLSKRDLSIEEKNEKWVLLYEHHKKLNPTSNISFEEWIIKYIKVNPM